MRTLPEEVKRPILEYSTRAKVTSQKLLVSLLEVLNPGGKEEVKSLQLWVRSPPTSQNFDEAFKVLRRWQLAVSRLSTLGLPPLSPHEKLGALDSILQKLEKRSEPLRFKLQALRMAPEIRRPQDAAVQNMLAQVEEEVRILQADERTKMNRQGITETVFRAEAKQAAKPAKKLCQFFAQGHCKKGDQCAYAHLSPCRFFVLGHCKHGESCRYPHVTQNKSATGAPKHQPKAPPKAKAAQKPLSKNPDTKQNSEPKPKIAAAEVSGGSEGQARASSVRSFVMVATTQSSASRARSDDERLVLIDSGANEVIRPFRPELVKKLQRMSTTPVALASGETISAHRTEDGELIIPNSDDASAEWIVPLERLTEGLDCDFCWKGKGRNPTLKVPQENGQLQEVQVIVKNRLPYITWADFQPLRKRLAKLWKGKSVTCRAASEDPSAEHSSPLPSSSSSEQGEFPTATNGRGLGVLGHDGLSDLHHEEDFGMEELLTLAKKLQALGLTVPAETNVVDNLSPECSVCQAAKLGVIDLDDDEDEPPIVSKDLVLEGSPQTDSLKELQNRCQQGLYDRQCETCLKSKGYRRPHRKLAAESISNGVLSMDLSGPHPVSIDGHKYILVTALRLASGTVLPFIRTLPNKESSTVLPALVHIMAQISSMTGGVAVYFRAHSDCGGEFTANKVVEQIHGMGFWKTTTVSHSPEANGVAERMVQKVKDDATRCLLHGRLPLTFWTFAARHGVFVARQRALGLPIPDSVPKVGQKVLVRTVNPDSFTSRLDEAVFLCEDETTPNGALVLKKQSSSTRPQILKTRMPLIPPSVDKVWRLESKDDQRVWVSNRGEIQWQEPAEWKEQMTFEERTEGPEMSKSDAIELVKKQMGSTEPSWDDFCKFGHGYLLSLGDDKSKPSCKVAKQAVAEETDKARYYILPFEMEEEMNKTEVDSQNLASAEPISQSVLWDEKVSEEERGKWINGLQTELDNMADKGVLLPVTRDEAKRSGICRLLRNCPLLSLASWYSLASQSWTRQANKHQQNPPQEKLQCLGTLECV